VDSSKTSSSSNSTQHLCNSNLCKCPIWWWVEQQTKPWVGVWCLNSCHSLDSLKVLKIILSFIQHIQRMAPTINSRCPNNSEWCSKIWEVVKEAINRTIMAAEEADSIKSTPKSSRQSSADTSKIISHAPLAKGAHLLTELTKSEVSPM